MQITDIRIRKIAKEYDVQLADMTDGEYEKYYFEDESHLALKGLVTFNEKIYDFYKQLKQNKVSSMALVLRRQYVLRE